MSIKISPEDLIYIHPFDELPVESQTDSLARIYVGAGRCSLKNIPAQFIDDDLRLLAVSLGQHAIFRPLVTESFMTITPSQTNRYEEIALLSIRDDCTNARHVDSTVMNNEFMKKALAVNGDALIPFLKDPSHATKVDITQDLIDIAISNSPTYLIARLFQKNQYRAHAVSQCITQHKFDLKLLLQIDHFETLIDVIKSGVWPNHFPVQPADLKQGIALMMLTPQLKPSYRAYVMSHPISDVIAGMAMYYKMELLNMYSRAELAPFLKYGPLADDREFKGRLLENEMGL